ncbi:hypothetical protein PanWU01x14_092920, partial [Parasponia andersonii]
MQNEVNFDHPISISVLITKHMQYIYIYIYQTYPFFEYNPKITTQTQSNGRIKKSNLNSKYPKMATFNPCKMGLRYIYLDDPCDETNSKGLVGGRMVAGIVTGGQKFDLASFSSSATLQLAG